eukprot:TRINITY_DN8872_c0_g1_i3.p1 TRINITY_DN8872_c0_g1~~TRINITY_DN8872_c0_g1_i3.p1  ORF type:complete len:355 (+),score=40.63 TRINITY_DN8872_c0_g1_i3:353-1417(+)
MDSRNKWVKVDPRPWFTDVGERMNRSKLLLAELQKASWFTGPEPQPFPDPPPKRTYQECTAPRDSSAWFATHQAITPTTLAVQAVAASPPVGQTSAGERVTKQARDLKLHTLLSELQASPWFSGRAPGDAATCPAAPDQTAALERILRMGQPLEQGLGRSTEVAHAAPMRAKSRPAHSQPCEKADLVEPSQPNERDLDRTTGSPVPIPAREETGQEMFRRWKLESAVAADQPVAEPASEDVESDVHAQIVEELQELSGSDLYRAYAKHTRMGGRAMGPPREEEAIQRVNNAHQADSSQQRVDRLGREAGLTGVVVRLAVDSRPVLGRGLRREGLMHVPYELKKMQRARLLRRMF